MKEYRTMKQHELATTIGVNIPVTQEADFETIMSKVPPTLLVKLKAAIELYKRSLEKPAPKSIRGSDDVAPIFRPLLSDLETEEVWALFLKKDSSVICKEKIHQGGFGTCPIEPKYIATRCLENRASGLVLVHNHPGGNVYPSEADIKQTLELKRALQLIDVHLLDHIIFAKGGEYYSCADERLTRK